MRYCFALIAVCLGLMTPAQAATSDDAMLRCASLFDQQARLSCYDGLVPPTLTVPKPGALNAPAPRQAVPQKRGWFSGMFGRSARPATNARLVARATAYTIAPFSHAFTITLHNGQIWRQDDGDTNTAMLTRPARDYSVEVEPGALGSYNMHFRDISGGFKVHRVK